MLFIDLPVGTYTVTASLAGHPTATGSTTIAVGQVTGNMYELGSALGGNIPTGDHHAADQPKRQPGAASLLTVGASGSTPLYYQWRQ